ncbi:MAG: VOC family protein [Acetivibrio sp.]
MMDGSVSKYILGIDHIGIAVKDIEEAELEYTKLGFEKVENGIIEDEKRKVKVSFIKKDGITFELIMPYKEDEKSPVDKFLKTNTGYCMYHICYTVSDIFMAIADLRESKYSLLQDPSEATAMGGRLETYMFHKKTGLIELIQST